MKVNGSIQMVQGDKVCFHRLARPSINCKASAVEVREKVHEAGQIKTMALKSGEPRVAQEVIKPISVELA
jgi:hypothetical protein